MPTGYTADLYEGKPVTPADFILGCARAFGALIEMRDDPADAPIPDEFKPSSYHAEKLAHAEGSLVGLEVMAVEEMERRAEADYTKALASWRKRRMERLECRQRYEAMLRHVRAWQPPTNDHRELKTFMIDQLEKAIDFDCSDTYDSAPPTRLTAGQWHVEQIEKTQRDIERHRTEDEKERQRAAERTEWVRALRASLPGASVPA